MTYTAPPPSGLSIGDPPATIPDKSTEKAVSLPETNPWAKAFGDRHVSFGTPAASTFPSSDQHEGTDESTPQTGNTGMTGPPDSSKTPEGAPSSEADSESRRSDKRKGRWWSRKKERKVLHRNPRLRIAGVGRPYKKAGKETRRATLAVCEAIAQLQLAQMLKQKSAMENLKRRVKRGKIHEGYVRLEIHRLPCGYS